MELLAIIKLDPEFLDWKEAASVRKELSDWVDVLSGVPQGQGSVLGPILFVLYVKYLSDIVSLKVKLFADDTKLYNGVQKGSSEGNDAIQNDLKNLKVWSDTWLLRFNAGKCKSMYLGSDNPETTYVLGGEEIVTAKEEKDLGVYLTDDCKPSLQCTKAAMKAMTSLRVIRGTFKYISPRTASEFCTRHTSGPMLNTVFKHGVPTW